MLQPRILLSARALLSSTSSSSSSSSTSRLTTLSPHRPTLQTTLTHTHHLLLPPSNAQQSRPASHAAQGRANKAAPGPGKRLGAKKGDSELVVPGNIIFRQRGTHWFPGENCGMGRDHTIFALQKGFVRYYRDPDAHPERKFIGIVFDRSQRLPRGRNSARRRRLGMVVREMSGGGGSVNAEGDGPSITLSNQEVEVEVEAAEADMAVTTGSRAPPPPSSSSLSTTPTAPNAVYYGPRPSYQYRMSNYEIGRAAEKAGVKVRPYKPNDRFLAWRKRNARKVRSAERRSLRTKAKEGRKVKKRR